MKTIILTVLLLLPVNSYSKPSALEMMESVFVGGYTESEIKSLMDKALENYNMALNEENYNKVGSVLVRMRKEFNVKEMDNLKCAKKPFGKSVDIAKAIALCTSVLASE